MHFNITKTLLSSKRLRSEILISFGLIFVTILVLVGYLFPGVSSVFEIKNSLPIIIGIVSAIILIGFIIVLQIIETVVQISKEAKRIASGDLDREIKLIRKDELGDLGTALNQMTTKLRDSVEELKKLKTTTDILNAEIDKRIILFSDLMEISDTIAQSSSLDEAFRGAILTALKRQGMNMGCLILKSDRTKEYQVRHIEGKNKDILISKGIKLTKIKLGQGILGEAILKQDTIVIDRRTQLDKDTAEIKRLFLAKNSIVVPISLKDITHGLFIVGNDQDDFLCSDSDKEFVQFVAKHIAVAVLNEQLVNKIDQIEVIDELTGLFNSAFARTKLNEEVERAVSSQKSCSFILLRINGLDAFQFQCGQDDTEGVLVAVAAIIKEKAALGQNDKVARFAFNEFALILPERNKKEAIELAKDLCTQVNSAFSGQSDQNKKLTCTSAVVENPIDGSTADELIDRIGSVSMVQTRQEGHQS